MTLALLVGTPLAVALLLVVVGARMGRGPAGIVGAGAIFVAFASAAAVAQAIAGGRTEIVADLGQWLPIRGADSGLRVDPSTLPLLLAVTAIATFIGIWAAASLRRDPGAARFFIALDLLAAALLVVLMARDLIFLVAGWQMVGVSAYLLIAQERQRPEASFAAARAFVVARAGDVSLLVAVCALLALFQTVDIEQLAARLATTRLAPAAENGLLAASLLVVLAALARAAQLPFQSWLPDRTQAPAPSVAAIHALVTMTGAILLIRLSPLLHAGALSGAATVGLGGSALAMLAAMTARPASRERWLTTAQFGIVIAACSLGSASTIFIVLAASVSRAATALVAGPAPWLARVVSLLGLVATSGALLAGAVPIPLGVGLVILIVLAVIEAALDLRRSMVVASASIGRATAAVRVLDVGDDSIRAAFGGVAKLMEQGGEQSLGAVADALARIARRASVAAGSFQRATVWTHESLLLVTAVAVVVYWIAR